MSDKGGKKSKKEQVFSVFDMKIILTGVVCTLLGIIFVLTLIFTGVIFSDRYHDKIAERNASGDKVIDVVGINYETAEYKYPPLINGGDGDKTIYQSFINHLGSDDNYMVISSKTDYDNVLSQISYIGGKAVGDTLRVSDEFFYSGSVILVTAETEALQSFSVNSVTRDENYNLTIDTTIGTYANRYGLSGSAFLIKIPNIQPKNVVVHYRTVEAVDDNK
jgi:hypothetical protein